MLNFPNLTYVCVSGVKKCSFFQKIWYALFSWNTRFGWNHWLISLFGQFFAPLKSRTFWRKFHKFFSFVHFLGALGLKSNKENWFVMTHVTAWKAFHILLVIRWLSENCSTFCFTERQPLFCVIPEYTRLHWKSLSWV